MELVKKQAGFSTRDIVLCGLFSALIAVGAFIKIPFGIVPMTLQTLFVALVALLLGPKNALISVATYIAIGLIGIPVFTGGGGITYVLHPTFGYLLGFCASAFLTGYIVSKVEKTSVLTYIIASSMGLIVMYIFGVGYYCLIATLYLGKTIELWPTIMSFCIVFIPGDLISVILASFLAKRLKPIITTEINFAKSKKK